MEIEFTPKQKAQRLVELFTNHSIKDLKHRKSDSIECAKLYVTEVLQDFGCRSRGSQFYTSASAVEYFEDVRKELILLTV